MNILIPLAAFAVAYLAGALDGPLWARSGVAFLAAAFHWSLWRLALWLAVPSWDTMHGLEGDD